MAGVVPQWMWVCFGVLYLRKIEKWSLRTSVGSWQTRPDAHTSKSLLAIALWNSWAAITLSVGRE